MSENKVLINQLQLAYAPLTAYEFANLKNDKTIEQALYRAGLYVIAQRPVITFENVVPIIATGKLNFEIHQRDNPVILKCELPIYQDSICSANENAVSIAINQLDRNSVSNTAHPFTDVHSFSLISNDLGNKKFLVWFSPEKLLQNWWKGHVECEIKGDYRSFTKYNVLYVGKATKQNILKRLSTHSTFQAILSLEAPVTPKQLPANEIVILPFHFEDNLQLDSFGEDSDINYMVETLMGKHYPSQERISLDAEKALIKAIKPRYNKELFKNYPVSKDGLHEDSYNLIAYTFTDPITLVYVEGEIKGGTHTLGGDTIKIVNGKDLILNIN